MPLQNREAKGYAVIIDMRGSARDKALHPIGSPAAEGATEPEATATGGEAGPAQAGYQSWRDPLSAIRAGKAPRAEGPRNHLSHRGMQGLSPAREYGGRLDRYWPGSSC